MKRRGGRSHSIYLVPLLVLSAAMISASLDQVFAQGSLGIGRPEQAIRPEGPFAAILAWIQEQQQQFYQSLTAALKAMREDGSHVWVLAGLSFAYGVFHAAGPGHGKAVISSYMIANEIAARRGIYLAFASAMLQALTAIVLIAALVFLLRGSGIRQGDLTRWLEIASYAGVSLLGAWLLFSKLRGGGHGHGHDHDHHHGHGHVHDHDCGHDHAPDPARLSGRFTLSQAWTAIVAVGLRPCSGAIIVLTFAYLNGLYFAGTASAFAMAIGTGITVSALAAMAVWAKDLAIWFGRASEGTAARIHRAIEIAGAAIVLALGLLLLSASLY